MERKILKKFTDEEIQIAIDDLHLKAKALEMVLNGASGKELAAQMQKPSYWNASEVLSTVIIKANQAVYHPDKDNYPADSNHTLDMCRKLPYPENLLADVLGSADVPTECIPSDIDEAIEYVFSKLTKNEQIVMQSAYHENMTIADIAEKIERTCSTVREIHRRALQKLRNPKLRGYLENGYTREAELRKKRFEMTSDPFSLPLDSRELSVRSYNCLYRAGVHTLGDLTKRTRSNVAKIRNLGFYSLMEIEGMMDSYGISFAQEDS